MQLECRWLPKIMTSNLVFILEDELRDRQVFELRIGDIGYTAVSYSYTLDAIIGFNKAGDVYAAYFLDMRVPFAPKEEPEYTGGLEVRQHLIERKVNPNKIFLMSTGVSHNDEVAAREYGVDPRQIIGKDRFTENMLRELLDVK